MKTARIALPWALVALLASSAALAQEEHTTVAPSGEHGEATEHAEGAEAEHALEEVNWFTLGGTRPDHEHPGQTKPNPPAFLFSVLNFALLVGILYYAVKKTVNPAMDERRKAAESEIDKAQRLKVEAESMHREYADRLAKLDDEIQAMKDEFAASGRAEAERIVTEATARAERMQREGEQMIEQEIRQLRTDLHRQAVEAAVASAEGAVRSAIAPTDQSRLADEYLGRLESQPRDGGAAS